MFMRIITLKDMTKAIENKIGLDRRQAEKLAGFIMDVFGYESRIIDNVLNPEERQIFYMLQAEGFLTAGREQTRLHDGREWLTYYWEMEEENIIRYAYNPPSKKGDSKTISTTPSPQTIYDSLSDEIWRMRKSIPGRGYPV